MASINNVFSFSSSFFSSFSRVTLLQEAVVLWFCLGSQFTKILGFHLQKSAPHHAIFGQINGGFLIITSKGWGERLKACAPQISTDVEWGQAKGQPCADPGEMTPSVPVEVPFYY